MLFGRLHRGAILTVVVLGDILNLTDLVASPFSESYPNHLPPCAICNLESERRMRSLASAEPTLLGKHDIMFSYSGLGT